MSIDPARWLAAVEATKWHRSQVQTFLYRMEGAAPDSDEGVRRAGAHVIRDCTLDPSKQEIFRMEDLTGEQYDWITSQAREVAALYETCIVINEYDRLRLDSPDSALRSCEAPVWTQDDIDEAMRVGAERHAKIRWE